MKQLIKMSLTGTVILTVDTQEKINLDEINKNILVTIVKGGQVHDVSAGKLNSLGIVEDVEVCCDMEYSDFENVD